MLAMQMSQSHVGPDEAKFEPVNFEFRCVLAEGSQMCTVSHFSSMIELYEKIAQCFGISATEIMYCTLNTAKVDMDSVLGGQIGLDDFIYVHRKGRAKVVEVKKSEPFIGLTIADNGNGCSYIRRIKEDSTASRIPFIKEGDHIESIMEHSMVGYRHYEVARFLKSIKLDEIFTLTLIEPVSSGFQQLYPRTVKALNLNQASGKTGTLRIRNNEVAVLEQTSEEDAQMRTALSLINQHLENFIGINDSELAEVLWNLALQNLQNIHDFAKSVQNSDLNEFKFNDQFILDVWSVVNDVFHGRIVCK